MKYKTPVVLSFILISFVLSFAAGSAFAESTRPEQKQKPGLYLVSRTDITSVTDEVLAGIYRDADESLMAQVREGLASRDINVKGVKSEQEIVPDPARFILVVAVARIELGGKRPFGRTAKVKVSYTLQNKDRFELVKRTVEETSVQKWQKCINKISEQIVTDTGSDLANQSVGKADDKAIATQKRQ